MNKQLIISIADYYADPGARNLSHRIKRGDLYACSEMAKKLAEQLVFPPNSVFVPAPSRTGFPTNNLTICLELARLTGGTVSDCIRGKPRPSLYHLKKAGHPITPDLLSLTLADKPSPGPTFVFDAVVDSGMTMSACVNLFPKDTVTALTYAMTDRRNIIKIEPTIRRSVTSDTLTATDKVDASPLQNIVARRPLCR